MRQSDAKDRQHLLYPDEHLLRLARQSPEKTYLKQIKNRRFETFSYYQVSDRALKLVSALKYLGMKPKDKVGIIAKNCAEWFICDFACMLGDFISVPIFPTANVESIQYCLSHSKVKLMFIGKLDDTTAIQHIQLNNPHIITVSLPYESAPKCHYQYTRLIDQFSPTEDISRHRNQDLMSIVYTSGTSGEPKGSMLTYGAFSWSVNQITNLVNINQRDRLFSYLPLSHVTERVYILGTSIEIGVETAFPESLATFIDDVKMHRPTLFVSVPRLWTLFYQRIIDTIPKTTLAILLQIPVINQIVRRKIAHSLGLNRTRVLGCGSAPVSAALLKWYEEIGLPITEAWGMSESAAIGTLNYPYRNDKLGSVGQAFPGVELKLSDEGEILMHGKCVFAGYYKNEVATRETLTEEGWLKTGDIGALDQQGYLTIKGRMKDSFKTAKGKFVSPSSIEQKVYARSRVDMVCLIGSGLAAPILLVVPHKFRNFDKSRYEHSAQKELAILNLELQPHEKIKGILMIKEPWTIENGILTPTLKIKRHRLEERYHALGENWPEGRIIQWEE